MTEAETSVIQQIIAPATMIPACGLLLLSSTARMNTVLARIRAFHHERLDVWASDMPEGSRHAAVRALRLEGLEHQTDRLVLRAVLLRITMLLLFIAVACNIVTVIALAADFVVEGKNNTLQTIANAIFITGISVMLASMMTSFLEVFRITETVNYEHDRVAAICASDAPAESPVMKPTSGEGMGL